MWFGVISLFPSIFSSLNQGITGRALKNQLIQLALFNPRDFTTDKYQTIDDRPYGGGPGMLLMAEPLKAAITQAKKMSPLPPCVIYLSPQGKSFTQHAASDFARKKALIVLAGRYEGIDERIIEDEVDEEWSIGDYILSGGELAAMVLIDVITRLIPGSVGDKTSVDQDSLSNGILKYPQYTRPETFNNKVVPPVLLSGHHQLIEKWRIKQALGRTWVKRPDLLEKKTLNKEELALLKEFIQEYLQK